MSKVLTISAVGLLVASSTGCDRKGDSRAESTDSPLPAFVLDTYPSPPPPQRRVDSSLVRAAIGKRGKLAIAAVKADYPAPVRGFATLEPPPPGAGIETFLEPSTGLNPPPEIVARWLIGQKFVYSRTLFGDRVWLIEPGEISTLAMGPAIADPAGDSRMADISFEVLAQGCGLAVTGSLRFYGDGNAGSEFAFRDLTVRQTRRIGRCG
jgi:hypothetical protein